MEVASLLNGLYNWEDSNEKRWFVRAGLKTNCITDRNFLRTNLKAFYYRIRKVTEIFIEEELVCNMGSIETNSWEKWEVFKISWNIKISYVYFIIFYRFAWSSNSQTDVTSRLQNENVFHNGRFNIITSVVVCQAQCVHSICIPINTISELFNVSLTGALNSVY